MRRSFIAATVAAVLLASGLSLAGSPAIAGKPTSTGMATAPLASPHATHGLVGVDAVSPDDIWAVGSHSPGGHHEVTWIRHFDGSRWDSVPSPSPSEYDNGLSDVSAVSDSDVWAVGDAETSPGHSGPLVEHWNGAAWSVVSPPVDTGWTTGVDAVGPDDVWVAGLSDSAYISHWDGSTWTTIPAMAPPVSPPWTVTLTLFYAVKAISPTNVWAVGTFDAQTESGGYDRQPLIEHWNGTSWSVPALHHEVSFSYLFDIDQVSAKDIWAVGTVDKLYTGDALVEHWNGKTWKATSTVTGVDANYQLWGVSAVSTDDVWATGYSWSGQQQHTLTQHWDGSSWTVVPAVEPSPHHNTLGRVTAFASDNVLTVGSYTRGAKERGLIERWNGTAWVKER